MVTLKEARRRHMVHYLELAIACVETKYPAGLRLNDINIRQAMQYLLAELAEAKAESPNDSDDFEGIDVLINSGHVDAAEGTPCPAIESGG